MKITPITERKKIWSACFYNLKTSPLFFFSTRFLTQFPKLRGKPTVVEAAHDRKCTLLDSVYIEILTGDLATKTTTSLSEKFFFWTCLSQEQLCRRISSSSTSDAGKLKEDQYQLKRLLQLHLNLNGSFNKCCLKKNIMALLQREGLTKYVKSITSVIGYESLMGWTTHFPPLWIITSQVYGNYAAES